MSNLPQSLTSRRPTRLCFSNTTPAVLRCADGRSVASKLQVVSVTGGLLSVPKPVNQGALVKLMFVTQTGPVLGSAEMLTPISYTQQPFRFVALPFTSTVRRIGGSKNTELRCGMRLRRGGGARELF